MKNLILAAASVVALSAPAFAGVLESEMHLTIDTETSELHTAGLSSGQTIGDDVSPVPLPAAGWMLLAGVGGLVALRRRARA